MIKLYCTVYIHSRCYFPLNVIFLYMLFELARTSTADELYLSTPIIILPPAYGVSSAIGL